MRLATLDAHFDAALVEEHRAAGRLFDAESTRDKVGLWLEAATRRDKRRS
jgi:hypothetical protein